jgi:hypothetical protein
MNTQRVGTDISGDISIDIIGGEDPVFDAPYQFKASVILVSTGRIRVTIQRGEGIDQSHAEIVIWQGSVQPGNSPVPNLTWYVHQEPSTAAGEIVYDVFFKQQSAVLPGANQPLTLVDFDPAHVSVTIRRKVPAVN